jgi:hypothetical protein
MSKSREYYRAYYAANRAHILAKVKAWRQRDLKHRREVEAAWRKAHPEAEAAKHRRYRQRPEIKARLAEQVRAKRAANPEQARAEYRAYYAKTVERRRTQARIAHAKARIAKGKSYSPRYSCRLPDWAPVGGARDVRSQWLEVNVTDSQRAYARELAIQRSQR